MEALEARDRQILLGIRLLVEIPPSPLLAVAREEDLDIDSASRRGTELHSQAEHLAAAERAREGLAAPAVVDIFAPVVAVHGETAAVPTREPEGRVRGRRVAEGQRDLVPRVVQDVHLVVDRLGPVVGDRAVLRDAVQRRVRG